MRPSPSKASSALLHTPWAHLQQKEFRSRAAPVFLFISLPRLRRLHTPFPISPFSLVSVAAEAPPVRRGPGIMPRKWQVWGRPDGSIVWVPVSDAPPNPPPPGPLRPAPHHPPPPDDAPVGGSISINVYTPAFAFISIMDGLLIPDLLSSAVRNPRPGRRWRMPHPLHGRPTPPR